MTVYNAQAEPALPALYYPDDFQYTSIPLAAADTDNFMWCVHDRAVIIDSISITFRTAAEAGSNDLTVYRGIYGTDASVAAVVTAARAVTTETDTDAGVLFQTLELPLTGNHNVLNAGDFLLFAFEQAATDATITINIRWRSQRR